MDTKKPWTKEREDRARDIVRGGDCNQGEAREAIGGLLDELDRVRGVATPTLTPTRGIHGLDLDSGMDPYARDEEWVNTW